MSEAAGLTLHAVDSVAFRRACSRFPTGIAVVTLRAPDGTPRGMTVNSFTSVSLEPPLILVCVELASSVRPHFRSTPYFAVNILAAQQRALSVRFAEHRGDRFQGVAWTPAESGAPLLAGALGALECMVTDQIAAGDHVVIIGAVLRAAWREGRPLVYFNSGYENLS